MDIVELLEKVRKRPAMYLTFNSIHHLGTFIVGHDCAVGATFDFRVFSYWIDRKYEICNTMWSWARILHHVAGDEEKALNLFFTDLDEYLIDLKNSNVPNFRTEFGAPKESVTNKLFTFR